MSFPNAAKGVKRIFTAEILSLIAALATLIGIVMFVITAAAADAGSGGGTVAAGSITLIMMTAASVLAIIGAIMMLVGIINASKDEGSFKTALYAILVSVIVAVINSILSLIIKDASALSTISAICQIIQGVMSICVTIFIIKGVINIADQLNNDEVAQKGRKLLSIIVVMYALSLIATLISLIFGGTFMSVTAAILALVAAILNVIAYITFLVLLAKAKNMLNE